MKKRGFTLVELLAVIVILAIIALIATPIILGVIETSKKGAAENSALGYTEAVEKQIARNLLDEDATNDITDGVYEIADLTNKKVKVKGDKPTEESWVEIEKSQVVSYSLEIGQYVVTYNKENKKMETTKNGEIAQKPSSGGESIFKYYAYGTPTTSSTTDFTTLGKNVFAFLGSDDSHGVCINNGNLFCLKTNDYDNSVAALKAHFGESNCTDNRVNVSCRSGDFNCNAHSDGRVDCVNYSPGGSCDAFADGSFSCI